jgi:hypothetical protein
MTVRVPATFVEIDDENIAAILTPALLAKAPEDDRVAPTPAAGTAWRQWGDAHGKRVAVIADVD